MMNGSKKNLRKKGIWKQVPPKPLGNIKCSPNKEMYASTACIKRPETVQTRDLMMKLKNLEKNMNKLRPVDSK